MKVPSGKSEDVEVTILLNPICRCSYWTSGSQTETLLNKSRKTHFHQLTSSSPVEMESHSMRCTVWLRFIAASFLKLLARNRKEEVIGRYIWKFSFFNPFMRRSQEWTTAAAFQAKNAFKMDIWKKVEILFWKKFYLFDLGHTFLHDKSKCLCRNKIKSVALYL